MSTDAPITYLTAYQDLLVSESISALSSRRVAQRGRDYVVIPLTMLRGDLVFFPSTARCPEMVPANVLSLCRPEQWNTRPIYIDHPIEPDGRANAPESCEYSMGMVQEAWYDEGNKALRGEFWLDVAQFVRFGIDDFLSDIEDGGNFGVSVGTWTRYIVRSGNLNGKPYCRVWDYYIAYHVALLPPGVRGACAIEDGCGTNMSAANRKENRMALHLPSLFTGSGKRIRVGSDTANASEEEPTHASTTTTAALAASPATPPTVESGRTTAEEGLSDMQLRSALSQLLYSTVPAFDWINGVWPADQVVVYSSIPAGKYHLWRRHFSIGTDLAVTLIDDVEEVQMVGAYIPVNATDTTAALASALVLSPTDMAALEAHQRHQNDASNAADPPSSSTPPPCGCGQKGNLSMNNPNVAVAPSPSQAASAAASPAAASTQAAPTTSTAAAPVDPAAWLSGVLATAPTPEARLLLEDAARYQQAEREQLMAYLTGAQTAYSADALKDMDLPKLREVAALVSNVQAAQATSAPPAAPALRDYSGRGLVTAGSAATLITTENEKKLGPYDQALARAKGNNAAATN